MIYGSVCSGIEAATQAWHPLGWRPAFFSEVEAFPCAVLKHHYPRVQNHDDMTKFEEWPDHAIDLLVGGTPCQSFSVAGLRQGLNDPRGNLMLTYLAIARRYQPRWLVWENVPGVLSSNGGRDFGTFIRGLEECGYHAAWRVLDAQYVRVDGFERAVPQRRRRVFVVGYLGDWRRAAAVLFEPEGMRGDSPPRREAAQRTAGPTAQGVALRGRDGGATAELTGPIAPALRCAGGGGDKTHVMLPSFVDEAARCDTAGYAQRLDWETENFVAHAAVPFDTTQITSKANYSQPKPGDPCHPLAAGAHPPAIAFDWYASQSQSMPIDDGVCPPLKTSMQPAMAEGWAVRRLTPRECERLQGFPDDFTLIPHGRRVSEEKLDRDFLKYQLRGNPKHLTREDIGRLAADGPRYKALGNSMAVNCMRWLGERIDRVEAMTADEAAE